MEVDLHRDLRIGTGGAPGFFAGRRWFKHVQPPKVFIWFIVYVVVGCFSFPAFALVGDF